jgi:beta-galactosidase
VFTSYDPRRWAPHLDVCAYDSYPQYHARPGDWRTAVEVSFHCDLYRALLGGRPFLLMETTPSSTNWMPVGKLKRPGIHRLTALQHIAHGAESVLYFQWRASRGATEKFHGAVVSHSDRADTRVFREVADLGRLLERLEPLVGTRVDARVAVVYDKETHWAIDAAAGPRRDGRDYLPTCCRHYAAFWRRAIPVDVVHADADLGRYRLVVAPMLYLLRPGVAERLEAFVRAGGTFVTTYWSGIADEHDLCFRGGFPGPLRPLLGLWAEELDVLYDDESVPVAPAAGNTLGLAGPYRAGVFCDLVHAESACVEATYAGEFYAGRPALTVNRCGQGEAWYIAFREADGFLDDFYRALAARLDLRPALAAELPEGVTVQVRTDGVQSYLFALNFTAAPVSLPLGDQVLCALEDGRDLRGTLELGPFGSAVCRLGSASPL